jgi:hypothetical protein
MASTNIQSFPGKVGVSNTNPIHTLDIGSNVYIDDAADTKLRVVGNIHASGITVDGNITVIETDNLSVKDPVLLLASGSTGTSDTGIIMKRADGDANVAVFYDEGVGLKICHTMSSGDEIHLTADTANALATSVYGPVTIENTGVQSLSVSGGAQINKTLQIGTIANLYVDTTTSNVGIGTNAPAYKLDVHGESNVGVLTASTIYGEIAGSNAITASTVSATTVGTHYGEIAGSNAIAASTIYGEIAGSNAITASTIYGEIAGSNAITASTIYGEIAGSNAITASTVSATTVGTHYGEIAGSNAIAASTIYGEIAGSNAITASTVSATTVGTHYGEIAGSNAIAASTGTFSGDFEVGTANLFVDTTTGNVGIGTASPSVPLHVSASNFVSDSVGPASSSNNVFRVTSTEVDSTLLIGASDTGSYISSFSKANFATERNLILNANGGNVGIGTTSPGNSRVAIYNNETDANSTSSLGLELAAPWIRIGDGIGTRTMSNGSGIKFHDSGVDHYSIGQKDGKFRISSTGIDGDKLFPSGYTEGIVMTTTGNVGIGTTNPQQRLHVVTYGNSPIRLESSTNPGLEFLNTEGGAGNEKWASITYKHGNRTTDTDQAIQFYNGNSSGSNVAFSFLTSSATTRAVMLDNGNVGIGTTSPDYKFHVYGDASGISLGPIAAMGYVDGSVSFCGIKVGQKVSSPFSRTALSVEDSGTTILHVDGWNQRVGIGTSSPDAPLVVQVAGTDNTVRTGLILRTPDSDTGTGYNIDFYQSTALVSRIAALTEGGGQIGMAFSTYNGSVTERMRIDANGNVGIGTDDPNGGLHVYQKTIVLGELSSNPATSPDGSMYYNTSSNKALIKIDGAWRILGESSFTPTSISGLVGWYLPENWTGTQWTDASGAGNNATSIEGTINYSGTHDGTSVGAQSTFPVLYGAATAEINFPSAILPSTYTLVALTRYNGTNKLRILDGQNIKLAFWTLEWKVGCCIPPRLVDDAIRPPRFKMGPVYGSEFTLQIKV